MIVLLYSILRVYSRFERSAYIPLNEDTQKFISRGPILAYAKDDAGQGEYTVNAIFLDVSKCVNKNLMETERSNLGRLTNGSFGIGADWFN